MFLQGERHRKYHVRLVLDDSVTRSAEVALQPLELLKGIETQLFYYLEKAVVMHLKRGSFKVLMRQAANKVPSVMLLFFCLFCILIYFDWFGVHL